MPYVNNRSYSWAEVVASAIENEGVPRYLYKYRPPGKFTDEIFKNHQLWFANTEDFNDPFDCQIVIETDNTLQEIEQFIQQKAPQKSRAERRKLAREVFANPIGYHKSMNESKNLALKKWSVCCFAEEVDNILMWSHYAQSHSGLCLKFDILKDPDYFALPLRINYSQTYPRYNHLRSTDKMIQSLMLAKSAHWAYEKEWRLFKYEPPKARPFLPASLIEVTFGCKTSQEFIKHIKSLATDSGLHHLIYKKALISKSQFALTIKGIS